jgi:hypothetical protein
MSSTGPFEAHERVSPRDSIEEKTPHPLNIEEDTARLVNRSGARSATSRPAQQEQQTGMLFMQRQQTHPALLMAAMQSQQAWIIVQHSASPLMQVMQTPSSVISHLHIPIVMLQQHTIMPFIIMQQLHMPPAIMLQRFCSIVADILSSHLQVIFIPPLHFSIFIVQRGTIIHCGLAGIAAVPPIMGFIVPMPCIPIPARSIIIALVIAVSPEIREGSFTLDDVGGAPCLTHLIIVKLSS